MVKITATKTKFNAALAIGGAVACFVPIVLDVVNGRSVSAEDFVSVVGCVAALFAGNVDRTNTGTAAVFRALKRDAERSGNGE
jgi:hypothetical protein